MSIITISRGSYSYGKEIAEKLADHLGYECVARDVILEASKEFNIPEIKLIHAIHDAPSIFDRFSSSKQRYVTLVQAALLEHFRKDNIVYHGLAGHFFVKDISHVLKIRIIADMDDRINIVINRDKITKDKARDFISKIDEERRRWSEYLYGIDTSDPRLYDMVIHVHKLGVADAIDLINHAVGLQQFQTTPESQKAIEELAIFAHVKAALMEVKSDLEVDYKDGAVTVKTRAPLIQEETLVKKIQEVAGKVEGVKAIKVNIIPSDIG